jgi:hypothetical protein
MLGHKQHARPEDTIPAVKVANPWLDAIASELAGDETPRGYRRRVLRSLGEGSPQLPGVHVNPWQDAIQSDLSD